MPPPTNKIEARLQHMSLLRKMRPISTKRFQSALARQHTRSTGPPWQLVDCGCSSRLPPSNLRSALFFPASQCFSLLLLFTLSRLSRMIGSVLPGGCCLASYLPTPLSSSRSSRMSGSVLIGEHCPNLYTSLPSPSPSPPLADDRQCLLWKMLSSPSSH